MSRFGTVVSVLIFLLFAGRVAHAQLESGLVAWWRMEFRADGKVLDHSGNGNDLLINGSPTFQGNIVVFNDDGTLEAADSDDLDLLGDWTVSYWAREDSNDHSPDANTTNGWMSKHRSFRDSEGGWFLNSSAPTGIGVSATIYGSPNCNHRTQDSLTLGAWYRLTTVFDSGTNKLRIYFNHNLEYEADIVCSLLGNDYSVLLGGFIEENLVRRPYCKGAMADVRIYNRTLSEPEIAQLVAKTIGGGSLQGSSIPAVSAWGMVAMVLLMFIAGTLVIAGRRSRTTG